MEQESSRKSLAFGVGYIVAAFLFGVASIVVGVVTFEVSTDGVKTSAAVVQVGGGAKHDEVTVEFRTSDGSQIRATVPESEVGDPDVGDTVRIRYWTNDPTFVEGAGWFALFMDTAMTICFATATVTLSRRAYRRIRDRARPRPKRPGRRAARGPAPTREAATARNRTHPGQAARRVARHRPGPLGRLSRNRRE